MTFDEAQTRVDAVRAETLAAARDAVFQPNRVMAEGLADGDDPPEWIQLTPGRTFEGRDGRRFKIQSARAMVGDFDTAGEHLLIDIDHNSELPSYMGGGTKAYGWITKLAVRNSGQLWAKVDWTPEGKELVTTKQFRSVSPTLYVTRESAEAYYEDGETAMEVIGLKSVALTNQPNLRIASLNTTQTEEQYMLPKTIVEALGLKPDATEADVLAAIAKNAEAPAPVAPTPDLTAYVPRSDYDTLNTSVAKLQADVAKSKLEAVDAAITEALKSGKITPASEAYHRAVCAQPNGLDVFKSFVASQTPIIMPNAETHKAPTTALNADELTDNQKRTAERLGVSHAAYLAELNAVRANPARMRATKKDE